MNEIVTQSSGLIPATTSASLEAIKSNFGIIQAAIGSVLKKDVHFGVIPGTGTKDKPAKPSLFKPGADVLCSLFHLAATYQTIKSDMGGGHREYEVTCTLSGPMGNTLGQGIGSASTMEPKYRYRKGGIVCPECGTPAIFKSKQDYGGGWFCAQKSGGCGANFKSGDERIANQQAEDRIEHRDPAEYYNTCLKMAAKRAQVAAVLTVTGASAVFTQDREDFRGNIIDADYEAEPEAPAPTETELLADLAAKAGLSSPGEISELEIFIRKAAEMQKKDPAAIAAGALSHLENFLTAFRPWLKERGAKAKKADSKSQAEAAQPAQESSTPPTDDQPAVTQKTKEAIDKELTRIGGTGGYLPPELASAFGTGDPSELTEAQGLEAVKFLKGIK